MFNLLLTILTNKDLKLCFVLTELECPEFYIKCDDGLQCIKEEHLCDFWIHCNDLSDENDEKCASKYIVLITNNYRF